MRGTGSQSSHPSLFATPAPGCVDRGYGNCGLRSYLCFDFRFCPANSTVDDVVPDKGARGEERTSPPKLQLVQIVGTETIPALVSSSQSLIVGVLARGQL